MSKVGHSGSNLGHGSCKEGKPSKKLLDFVKTIYQIGSEYIDEIAQRIRRLRFFTGKEKIGTGTSTYVPTPSKLRCFVTGKDRPTGVSKTDKGYNY